MWRKKWAAKQHSTNDKQITRIINTEENQLASTARSRWHRAYIMRLKWLGMAHNVFTLSVMSARCEVKIIALN